MPKVSLLISNSTMSTTQDEFLASFDRYLHETDLLDMFALCFECTPAVVRQNSDTFRRPSMLETLRSLPPFMEVPEHFDLCTKSPEYAYTIEKRKLFRKRLEDPGFKARFESLVAAYEDSKLQKELSEMAAKTKVLQDKILENAAKRRKPNPPRTKRPRGKMKTPTCQTFFFFFFFSKFS